MKANAYDEFREKPTAANAIRLAIADHKAHAGGPMGVDWQFVSALQVALEAVEHHAELATAIRNVGRVVAEAAPLLSPFLDFVPPTTTHAPSKQERVS